MTKIYSVIAIVLVLGVLVQTMHVHPSSAKLKETEGETDNQENFVVSGINLNDIQNIRSTRFVPVNNPLFFFKSFSPCDEGYERDFLGICRQVW